MKIILWLGVWYILSSLITIWFYPEDIESKETQAFWAGIFMAPAWVPLLFLCWLQWRIWIFAWKIDLFGIVPYPIENPFDLL